MPNVPKVPGVPTLSSYGVSAIALLVADAVSILLGNANTWSIFLDGEPAFDFQSFVSLGYRKDFVIATYPVEGGGFMSYDKVEMPAEIHLRITSGGTEQDRQALISAIDAEAASTNLYDIVTPENVYSSYTIEQVSYQRSATNGLGMIIADIALMEVRLSAPVQFTNTQNPVNQAQQGNGNVQPQAPSSQVSQDFESYGGVQ